MDDRERVCLLPLLRRELRDTGDGTSRSSSSIGESSCDSFSQVGRGCFESETTVVFRSVCPAMVPTSLSSEKNREWASDETSDRLEIDDAGDFGDGGGENSETDMVFAV